MSELVKRHILCIQALNRYKNNKLRRAILANADADLICALAECAYNILKGNVPLTPTHRRRLKKYRKELRELAKRRLPIARRRHPARTDRWFPIGFTSSVGRFGDSSLAHTGARVDGARAKNGLGGSTIVGDPSITTTAYRHGW